MSQSPKEEDKLNLQLGDIIQIIAPTDDDINEKVYYITYIDLSEILLINNNGENRTLFIDDGKLRNESIESIIILSRSEELGYARQNNLIPENWIDIYFSGDVPFVLTGKITNLEEDQIEITLYEDNQKIYIDFAYKGIPKDIPIEKIVIRESPPDKALDKTADKEKEVTEIKSLTPASLKIPDELQVQEDDIEELIPKTEVEAQIKNLLLDADQIIIGEELEAITQIVDVPEQQQRYGIETQTNDLLDELLSTIPNVKRTETVLNNIHKLIQRFKQLREEFSTMDEQNNALMPKIQGADYKPLVKVLEALNKKLYWLLPVAKNIKKLYDLDLDVQDEFQDVIPLTVAETRIDEERIINTYLQNLVPDGENKYSYLLKELNPYLTPYNNPDLDNILVNKRVNANITAVIDNMEDFYSSIAENDNVKRRRFLIQEYNLGQNMLDISKVKGGNEIVSYTPVTLNDNITIKSLLILPESAVNFSHINLPSTNIMIKANLNQHFIQYWQLLNKSTITSTEIVDNIEKPLEHDINTFLNNINEYVPDASIDDENKYKKFLETVIPKTRVLFELIKSNINEKLSIYDLLKYLEPFMIYQKDLSFKQYEEFNIFISEKIKEFKKKYSASSKEYNYLLERKSVKIEPSILRLINKELLEQLKEYYQMDKLSLLDMSNSELLEYMNSIDNCRYYNTIISSLSINLMISNGSEKIEDIKEWYDETSDNINKLNNDCNKHILSKEYLAIDEMEEDNGKEIFFDKKYDNTYYDLINEYEILLDRKNMSMEDMIQIISLKLQENNGLSINNANRDAKSLLLGKKLVEDGDYALVKIEDEKGTKYLYYKREDNTWIRDVNINEDLFIDSNKLFCNLDQKCLEIKNKCETLENSNLLINEKNIKELLSEFSDTLNQNKDVIIKNINKKLQENMIRLPNLINIKDNNIYKNNQIQYNLGLNIEEDLDRELSPYIGLRDLILGQGDFVKRQNDISKFVTMYTRPANNDSEDKYWLYCIVSNQKLLPTFIAKLATVFINQDNYLLNIQKICAEQGTISDEGDLWVDKHSGYTITQIDFDNEEGFTEEGYKITSRSIMEADLGSVIINSGKQNVSKFENPETEKISNIATAIANYSGIDIKPHLDFIIRNTMQLQARSVQSKAAYEKAVAKAIEKGKKGKYDTYEIFSDQSLLIITLSYYLIAVVTSIPSIKTKKRFPGCIRSFSGFPLTGVEDKSAMIYIACIANKIKSSISPWNSIQKLNEKNILDKIENTITKMIISQDVVQEKIQEKLTYIKLNQDEDIPIEHDIKNWINFLPPLFSTKIGNIQNYSTEFGRELESNLKTGSINQDEKINILKAKIIFFAIKIIESIQSVVTKKTAILTNNNKEPFLENSCCDDGSKNTIDYFANLEPNILNFNNTVKNIHDLLIDINVMGKAGILFNPTNTKRKYPEISSEFTEDTIYRAFIVYCKYNSNIPISEELRAICMEKPDSFDINDSIDEKIRKLKRDGKIYSNEMLQQLMSIINRKNIVNLVLYENSISNIQILRDICQSIQDRDITIIPNEFITNMQKILDTFEIGGLIEDTPEMREMKNYLNRTNEIYKEDILSFMQRNISKGISKDFQECINNISNFKETGNNIYIEKEDETIYKMITFISNISRSLIKVYPNMILHEVDYSNVTIPSYWKLSDRHNKDLKDILNKHYSSLYKFYNNKELNTILTRVQDKSKDLFLLIENTQFYAPINTENGYVYSIFDRRLSILLFKFYFLSIIKIYISILDDEDIILQASMVPVIKNVELSPSVDLIREEQQGLISDIETISGEKKKISENIASLLSTFTNIICKEKDTIDYNYETLMERVLRSKEKEKDIITNYLKEMTDEEREIENLFKNNKLEKWSKGLQKGIRIYQADTYDEERKAMEDQALLEFKLGTNDLVTEMNRNIYVMDQLEQQTNDEFITNEENDLSNYVGEDDDYGDLDGDEYY